MKIGQVITAIDIGTTKICVIIAQINEENKLEVKGIGTSKADGMVNGIVVDIMKASKSMSDSINEAEEMATMKAKNIYVGIAGEHIKSQNTIGRISLTSGAQPCDIDQQHVENVISNSKNNVKIQQGNERLEIIHAIPQYYKIDDQDGIMNPVNMSGFNLSAHVHIVMADINALRNIKKCIEIAGYKVEESYLEPIASSHAVLDDVEKDLGSIIIDIGGGTTDIAIFYKDSIRFSAVLPIGGKNITHDLSVGLHTSPQNAEKLKIELGNSLSSRIPEDKLIDVEGIGGREPKKKKLKYMTEIIEARMREIFEGAYRILNEHHDLGLITAGLVLTGGASLLRDSSALADQIFNMPTKIGYPNLTDLAGPTEKLENPRYATTVGILYYVYAELQSRDETITSIKIGNKFTNLWQKIKNVFKDYF
ncbi:MAG: cell division protein FtsA [Candidatus Cloacimonetes bacterium]|jgi:cell division protein FtsA|nr:cell division protein FtsA [Candidatus Cloacimonadota bacterium]MBT4332673.1 cell division protein FtsA [Candidatus Cloacimonadota bacterium]MBT4575736.1 cell division protein FtsA [Candidatus Cloacimonadota bacterium]MBT5420706.1 cell division protein FtsA [Candidatus Cloacimonadota bacterium]